MIWILGAGAFGTGLAISLSQTGSVTLWTHDPVHAETMQRDRQNTKRLPGFTLPQQLRVTSDLGELPQDTACLICVPTQKLRVLLERHRTILADRPLITCCKGIELTSGLSPSQVIAEIVPSARPAVLTGPSFASDIAKGLPAALSLACADSALGEALQAQLSTPNLRIYRTKDVTGAELGGALKNVMAIACGVTMGAKLGDSARAALMTRGFAEMQRIAVTLGADPDTLIGLSGFGDLTLTCSSDQSRNYRFGFSLGQGEPFESDVTVEGVATAHAMLGVAEKHGVDVPITYVVDALATGQLRVGEAVDMLLRRPLKEE
jgi:glycerol-3-phosphate dehydrogenase (NAD(P)+)